MGNISYVTSRSRIDIAQVGVALAEINRDRFQGNFDIHPDKGGGWGAWCVSLKGVEYPLFEIRRSSSRKVGSVYPHLEWASWVFVVFMNDLAIKLKGWRIGEEPGKWQPRPGAYPTYEEWIQKRTPEALAQYLQEIEPHFPNALKAWFRRPKAGC